ncbi:MAG: saccharopine dehydrogenase C-terminal domain-containing protein [Candidatus Bipolaricaulaceae bacterium]
MGYRYLVVGAGRQGVAAAYDLAARGQAEEVVIADLDLQAARRASERVNRLLGGEAARPAVADATCQVEMRALLAQAHGMLSAVPFHLNLQLAHLAVESGVHMVDLGGHTGTVHRQLALQPAARDQGVTLVPDCGMGPGMNIAMAVAAMDLLDKPTQVRVYDGGLPQRPKPPWDYALSFHVGGLINEYQGDAHFLRDGEVTAVPALTELEELEIPPLGRLEAFVTSGGLSVMPWNFRGRLQVLENKTLRYPGHCARLQVLRDVGMFATRPVRVGEAEVAPHQVLAALLAPRLVDPQLRDVCVIHVRARGTRSGRPVEARVQLVDRYDPDTGFLAMERLTGWHAAIVLAAAVRGKIPAGVVSVDQALSGEQILAAAAARGWTVDRGVYTNQPAGHAQESNKERR